MGRDVASPTYDSLQRSGTKVAGAPSLTWTQHNGRGLERKKALAYTGSDNRPDLRQCRRCTPRNMAPKVKSCLSILLHKLCGKAFMNSPPARIAPKGATERPLVWPSTLRFQTYYGKIVPEGGCLVTYA